jgi:glycosyltransferase involved in cell wall biosynthesis
LPRVLVVSSFFPPLNSAGGSIRLVKFIKYLSDMGWDFVIYTRAVTDLDDGNGALSSFLLDELPKEIVIKRIAGPVLLQKARRTFPWIQKIGRRLFGESSLSWGIAVFWNGLTYMRESNIDLIFGVTPPFTNALAAVLLSCVGRKPLVLDLKDDWIDSPSFFQKNVIRQKVEKMLESLIVHRAAAVITVTPQSYNVYKKRYARFQKLEIFHLIPNGCDLNEYGHLSNQERSFDPGHFLIMSAAWGFRKDYRDITPFLQALALFIKRYDDLRNRIHVALLGESLSKEYHDLLLSLGLDDIVQNFGALGRDELVNRLRQADLFLLIQPVNNTTAISGTLYEYWATGKAPVLLISEIGASSALVDEHHLGRHFHFDQIEQISAYIEYIFKAHEKGHPVWIERGDIQNYDRKVLTDRMDDIWRKVISNSEE